jgi:hypothetical protein
LQRIILDLTELGAEHNHEARRSAFPHSFVI